MKHAHIDLPDFVKRIELKADDDSVFWIDLDTGLIVYDTTVKHSSADARSRALAWARFNHFTYDAVDHGRYRRAV